MGNKTEVLTMPDELKPCPFCGGEARLIHSRERDGNVCYDVAFVGCSQCHAETAHLITDGYYGETTTEEDAVRLWQRRVGEGEKG